MDSACGRAPKAETRKVILEQEDQEYARAALVADLMNSDAILEFAVDGTKIPDVDFDGEFELSSRHSPD